MRVVIGEDNALLREGLGRILDAYGMEVVATAVNEPELGPMLDRSDIDLALLDVRMPPGFSDEGLRAAVTARQRRPTLPILVLSQYVEHLYARELLASGDGSVGYLLKDRVSAVASFVDACRQVAHGGTVLDPHVVQAVMGASRATPVQRLTAREREVLALVAEGRSNAAIATALFITEKAVVKHTNSIFTKLDLPVSADDNRRVRAVLAYLEET